MSEPRPKAGDYIWHDREQARVESYEVRFGDRDAYREGRGWLLARCWTAEDAAICASAFRVEFGAAIAPPKKDAAR